MIKINTTLKANNNILKALKQSKADGKIGILKENNPSYQNGMSVASVLAIHTHGSISRNIPKRDPLFAPFFEKKEDMIKILQGLYNEALKDLSKDGNTKKALVKTLNDFCFYYLNDVVKQTILSNGNGKWESLSEKTIAKKMGSTQMLVDTGLLIKSLNFKVK